MGAVDLTRQFSPDQLEHALESWAWIGLEGKTPLATSLFGDVFLEDNDGIWFLDTIDGTLRREWDSRASLLADLETTEGQDRFLLGGLALAAHSQGIELAPNEVFDFVKPPILGGEFSIDNIQPMDFVVKINIAGQLINQVRQLPPGTKISGFTVDGG